MAGATGERRQGMAVQPAERVLRALGVAGLAGCAAAFIAAGVGSRLAMRVTALMAGHAQYGRLTEADARVGQVTTEGTLFLLVFGTFIGFGGGLLFLLCRRWLPWRGRRLGLAFSILLLCGLGSVTIAGSNVDFRAFGSPVANVAMFAALHPLFGFLMTAFYERLERRVPVSRPRGIRLVLWDSLLVGGAASLGFGTLVLTALTFGVRGATGVITLYLVVVAPVLARQIARRLPARTAAMLVAAPAVLLGGVALLGEVRAIITA